MKKATKISLITLCSVIVAVVVAVAIGIGIFFVLIDPDINLLNAPDLDESQLTSYSRTVSILDKDGNPIDDALYDSNKIYVCIDDLPQHTIDAFIAIEDKRFYDHGGIDYKRMAAALIANIKARKFREGASTITQQLIKNTHLSNEKTLRRKINEMRLARRLERVYDKDRILESYFNILYFGSGIRGLGTASRVMFGRPASELTLAQSAALASIINNPTKYSPYKNPDNLADRKELVLRQMLNQGYINEKEYSDACSEAIDFNKDMQNQFVEGLLRAACVRFGCSEKELFLNNYSFLTAYDGNVVESARKAIKNTGNFNGIIRVLVLDNPSGAVVCDETNRDSYINPRRSPASTVKPFLSYAPALENGLNPLSQILDEPTVFGDYSPSNYKNVYRGYQSLQECLIHSSNIAAVKLLRDYGIESSKSTASLFGLPFEETDNSLSIALGGMEKGVTLLELANAYRTLANGGLYSEASYFRSINNGDGIKIDGKHNVARRAVNDDTAYLITDMLTECARSGTAKRLKYSGVIAAKTGTNGDSDGNYDCYCIAYTPDKTIAVWFGADGAPIDNGTTGASCCNIIKDMCRSGAIDTNNPFRMPDSVAYYEIDDNALRTAHEVYLADPLLPKRYRRRALLSKRHLPIRKDIDLIDYYDRSYWDESNLNGYGFDIFDNFFD